MATITVNQSSIYSGPNGGTYVIGFTASDPITTPVANSYVEWVTTSVEYNQQTRTGTVTIVVSPNTDIARAADVVLQALTIRPMTEVSALVSISQAAGGTTSEFNITSYATSQDGSKWTTVNDLSLLSDLSQRIEIKVSTSLISEVVPSTNVSWLRFRTYFQDNNEYEFYFNLDANPDDAQREAVITFNWTNVYGEQGSLNVTATQLKHNVLIPVLIMPDVQIPSIGISNYRITSTYVRNLNSILVTSVPSWVTIEDYALGDPFTITLTVAPNTNTEPRSGEITAEITSSDNVTDTTTMKIMQDGSPVNGEFPSWRDVNVKLNLTADPVKDLWYDVVINGNTVYSGHAQSLSDQEQPSINLTPIVQNYIYDTLDLTSQEGLYRGGYVTADVFTTLVPNEHSTLTATVSYYIDYTFNEQYTSLLPKYPDDIIRNNYISERVLDSRQYFIFSFLNHNGHTGTYGLTLEPIDEQTIEEIVGQVSQAGIYNYLIKPLRGTTITTTFIPDVGERQTRTYTVHDTCSKYCIYYLNTRGGWDSILFKNPDHDTTTETYDTTSILNDYLNTTSQFGKYNYVRSITTSHKLTTDYMTDEESANIIELLRSTKAYMHDLDTGSIIPIIINNGKTDIKTYRNQGRKLFTYTIEVEESQYKYNL